MAERVLDIDATAPSDGRPALLDRHTELLDSGLRKTAPHTRGLLRQMSAYHLGWTDAQGRPADEPAGKRIRPALALWACESLGGEAGGLLWRRTFGGLHRRSNRVSGLRATESQRCVSEFPSVMLRRS